MTDDKDIAHWDAAYVLGALSPQDRREYEDYLAANPDRAEELTEFAGLPGILNALSPEEAVALDATPDDGRAPMNSISSLAQAAQRRQRRSRRNAMALVAATAAAFLAVGVIVTTFLGRPQSTAPTLQAMAPGGRSGITAELAVTEKQWGTRLDWSCEYTKDWSRNVGSYDLVVTAVDGRQTTVGSWRPSGDDASGLSAATVIPKSQIRSVDIRVTGTDAPLVTTTL